MASRRKFLFIGGVAAGTLAIAGGGAAGFVLSDRYQGWIEEVLRRSLPGYDLEPNGLARFTEEYYAQRKDNARLRLFAATQTLFDTKWALTHEMTRNVDKEERLIISDFLIGSDFFENYPKGPKQITYRGRAEACGSPFATF
jgi:hypothetical protein